MKFYFFLTYLVLSVSCDRFKRIVGGEKSAIPKPFSSSTNSNSNSSVSKNKELNFKESSVPPTTKKSENQNVIRIEISEEERSSIVYGNKEKDGYYSFKGIQFAEPPVGYNRFQRPIRKYLNGEIQALKYGPPCVQPLSDNTGIIGEEDCLYLNVYTPRINSKNMTGLPVLFWIHGGGFIRGSGNQYGVSKLIKKNIVVVTINYRLGTLGFLGAHDQYMSGNSGLFDIYAAFAWTQNYISYFDGNPQNIFVGGQGSGASIAILMAQSAFLRDSIKGVIAMSGTGISSNAVDYSPSNTSNFISESNGCFNEENKLKRLRCLQSVDIKKLVITDTELQDERIGDGGFVNAVSRLLSAGPIIEGESDSRFLNYFLNNNPIDALKNKQYPKIPLLIGVTKDETAKSALGKFREDIFNKLKIPDFLTKMLPLTLVKNNVGIFMEDKIKQLTKMLFDNKSYANYLTNSFSRGLSDFDKVIATTTDALFNLPAATTSKLWDESGGETYFYRFEHTSKQMFPQTGHFLDGLSTFSSLPRNSSVNEKQVVSHGDDLLYLFDLQTLNGEPLSQYKFTDPNDTKITNLFTNVVTSFLQYKKPRLPELKQEWPLFKDKNSYVVISEKPRIEKQFRFCQLAIWEGVTDRLGDPLCNLGKISSNYLPPNLPTNNVTGVLDKLPKNRNTMRNNLFPFSSRKSNVEYAKINPEPGRLLSHFQIRVSGYL